MLETILTVLVSFLAASGLGNAAIALLRKKSPAGAKIAERLTLFAFVQADRARGVDLEAARGYAGDVLLLSEASEIDRVALSVVALRLRGALGKPQIAKAPSVPVPPLTLVALPWAFLVGMLSGCGAAQLQEIAQVSSEIVARAEPCLVAQYGLEQDRCLDELDGVEEDTCIARVREAWAPIIAGLVELRTVRCEIEPAKCPAKDGR